MSIKSTDLRKRYNNLNSLGERMSDYMTDEQIIEAMIRRDRFKNCNSYGLIAVKYQKSKTQIVRICKKSVH